MIYSAVRQALFLLPPESVHHLSLHFLRQRWFSQACAARARFYYPNLTRRIWNLTFSNPIGLAAGFDKNAVALNAWEDLGFGFAEIGTVTPRPQPGNPCPRIFRIPESKALINRMGFPNDGAEVIAHRLEQLKASGRWPAFPVGINIGKQKETPAEEAPDDYLASFRLLRPYADYFVINVSSPNTPGLRDLQRKDSLDPIVQALVAENKKGDPKPILVKIAPDLSHAQIEDVLTCISENQLDGIVATNTTIDKSSVRLKETGGLSGLPLRQRSTEIIRFIANATGGRLPIIGAGGIFTSDDAKEKLDAGATLLQIYTGFIYQGPLVVSQICRGLISE